MLKFTVLFVMWKLTPKQVHVLEQKNYNWILSSPNYFCYDQNLLELLEHYQGYNFSQVKPLLVKIVTKDGCTLWVCRKECFSIRGGIEFAGFIEDKFKIPVRHFHDISHLRGSIIRFNEFEYMDCPRIRKEQRAFIYTDMP